VTRGVLDGSVVHPREVFKQAIAESAAAIVLVHNHPPATPARRPRTGPSRASLRAPGEVVGIPVLDHVVIGDGRYVSFVEAGML
jgi:DNA repair protein RadC